MTEKELLKWCADNHVTPRIPSKSNVQHGYISDAGCGCCSEGVELTDEVIEALNKYLSE